MLQSQALRPHAPSQFFDISQKMALWIHENQNIVKTLTFALFFFGVGLQWISPGSKKKAEAITSGSLLTVAASLVSFMALNLLIPPQHKMKRHQLKAGKCENGELHYEGDVPILTIKADYPYEAGMAHGYLCGEAIHELVSKFDLLLHTIGGQTRAEKLIFELDLIKKTIPKRYLREMKGLVQGYLKWAKEIRKIVPENLTLDDVLLYHLIPDSLHLQPENISFIKGAFPKNSSSKKKAAIAFTTIVSRNAEQEIVFSRNMEWPSLGTGKFTVVINRRYKDKSYNTVDICTPGFVGILTGMNSEGLSIGMNVCAGETVNVKGMPACLFNRACLDQCKDISEVKAFIEKNTPIGPYHLTVVDPKEAISIHFYQSDEGRHVVRELEDKHYLSTLNCRYSPIPNQELNHSAERQYVIDNFFQENEGDPEKVLSLFPVNNFMTTHRIVMIPETRTLKVAFDNAFAGKEPLHEVATETLFN